MLLVLVVAAVLALVLAAVAVSAAGTARFRERYRAEKEALLERARSAPARTGNPAAAASLPAPVRRYLELTGAAGRPALRTAVLRQRGRIRAAADKPWMPFQSEQVYSTDPPGFVWLARAHATPLVHVMARDAFLDGRGHLLVRLLGVLTVADGRRPHVDQGAALRYWGEIVSFPEAVLDPRLRWEPIDDRHARLVAHGAPEVSAVVEFDVAGLPAATHAERYRDVGGRGVLTPWSGHSLDWRVIDGRLFPSRWRSVWHLAEGDLDAVELEILGVETG